jgi:hypothetical protein
MTSNRIEERNSGVPKTSRTTRRDVSTFCYKDYVVLKATLLIPNTELDSEFVENTQKLYLIRPCANGKIIFTYETLEI